MVEVKRLFLKNEIDLLRDLLLRTPIFKKHYPGFGMWLKAAVDECKSGKRLAFGVFKGDIKNSVAVPKLIGGCILKVTEGYTIEMKSLLIEKEEESKKYGQKLSKHIEEHSIKRGFRRIITDVPCEEQRALWFLVQQGYKIDGRTDRYKEGDPCYLISKELRPYYTGDPFDWEELSLWFLNNVYNITVKEELSIADSKNLFIEWKIEPIKEDVQIEKISTKGIASISESCPSEEIISQIRAELKKREAQVLIIFAKTGVPKEILEKFNVIAIDEKKVQEFTRFAPYDYGKEDIKGMVVEIKNDYFDRIREDCEYFVYFKGAPIGKYLENKDKIFFYVGPTSGYVNGYIGGGGEVVEIDIDEPSKIWKKFENRNPIFENKDEFDAFAEYKKKLLAIVIKDFRKYESPIIFSEIREIVNNEDLKTDDLGHLYFNDEIINNIYENFEKKKVMSKKEELEEEKDKSKLIEKILSHLNIFKKTVEKNTRQAFWKNKDELSSKPEEIGKAQLGQYFTGSGIKDIFVEARAGKGESDMIFDINKQKQLFETKIWYDKKYVMVDGIGKLESYMDAEDLNEAYYVVFVPRNPKKIIDSPYKPITLDSGKIVHMVLIDISR